MQNEMRLPTLRGDGSEDPKQQWFLCEGVWSIKNITDEVVKTRSVYNSTLRDHTLSWYMKLRPRSFPTQTTEPDQNWAEL